MEILQSLILGIVQGLTEFLPVSSSGHLIVVPYFLGWPKHDRAFDAFLHLGTMIAILVAFRREIKTMITAFAGDFNVFVLKKSDPKNLSNSDQNETLPTLGFQEAKKTQNQTQQNNNISLLNPKIWSYLNPYTRLSIVITVISIPVFIIGFLLDDFIEQTLTDPFAVALFMLFGTVIMFFAEKQPLPDNIIRGKTRLVASESYVNSNIDGVNIPFIKALGMSLSQIAALFPGISRSGITISTGMFFGIDKNVAAKFTFLMSIPVILGAGIYSLKDLEFSLEALSVNLVGLLFSFGFGIIAIKLLLQTIRKYGFRPFIIYRVLLSIIIIIYTSL